MADFLSRLDTHYLEEDDQMMVNSDKATIHSGRENWNDHIFVSDSLINIFKNQIIVKLEKKIQTGK